MTSLVLSQGDLYAGGTLYEAGNYPVQSIARWDGTNWTSVGSGIPGVIFALGSDGTNVYAGGRFDSAGGISSTNIAKWDGTKWSGLGLGIVPILEGGINVGTVDSLLVDGSNVYVGGRFRRAGNVAATNIARWDGANWHAMGNGLRFFNGSGSENGSVRTLAIVGRQLFAGGEFRLAGNGVSATNVAVWDGTSWSAVESGVNDGFGVLASAASGNDFYAAGAFRRIGGISANRIARWDGNEWNSLGSGIDGQLGDGVSELAASGTELFVAGLFPRAGSKPSKNIALWHIPHSLNISQSSDQVQITWPSTGTNFLLEAKDGLQSTNWFEVPRTPGLHDDQCVVTEPVAAPNRVYRLRRKPW